MVLGIIAFLWVSLVGNSEISYVDVNYKPDVTRANFSLDSLPDLTLLEYFLDNDPGYGQGIHISFPIGTTDIDTTLNLSLAGVSEGIHILFLRVQDDNGSWSHSQKRIIYVTDITSPNNKVLERIEYFIDNDPGYGQGISLPIVDSLDNIQTYNIDLSQLNAGIHILNVRAKDTFGQWSLNQERLFYVTVASGGTKEVVEVEYFINVDPGQGMANQISDPSIPGVDLDLEFVATDPADGGSHTVYSRAKDSDGMWSFIVSDTLVESDNQIEVTYPNGGQGFMAGTGTISNINWDTTNVVGNVDILLTHPNGQIVETIVSNIDPQGPYASSWPIPAYINAGPYRILIRDSNIHSISDLSDNTFTINNPTGSCDNFTDLYVPSPVLDAASCLCSNDYVDPQDYAHNNTYGVNPTEDILRADLAKLVYLSIYQGDSISPAEFYPVPFLDLQEANEPYFRYAKALSYLEYDDEVTPFNRDFINFRPFDKIEFKYAAKVITEAYDFTINQNTTGPILSVPETDEAYKYLQTLSSMGLLQNVINQDANDFADRQDIFLVLHNILNACSSDCTPTCLDPSPTADDYFMPGNFTPFNLSRSFSMQEGYFDNYSMTSYSIPSIGLPLEFSHKYCSHLTLLQKPLRRIEPLGTGWTHSYNSYIIKENGWTEQGASFDDNWIVFWPGGNMHFYSGADLEPLSDRVYDRFKIIGDSMITITKLNQIVYAYEKFTLPSGEEIYLLDEIKDRNNNKVDIVNELAIIPRIDKVIGPAGRVLDFNYVSPGFNKIESIDDIAGGRTVYFNVDSDDNLLSYTDAKSNVTTYQYEDTNDPLTDPLDHLLYSITRPEGNIIKNTYNNGFISSHQLGSNVPSTTSVQYDYSNPALSLVSTHTDAEGLVTTSGYNHVGYMTSSQSGVTNIDFSYNNSSDESLVTNVNENGLDASFTYNDNGLVTSINFPLGITNVYTYTALNDIKTITDPEGSTTTYGYKNSNLSFIEDNLGFKSHYFYDNSGLLQNVRSPELIDVDYTYDNYGNMLSSSLPLGIVSTYDYDAIGRLEKNTNALSQIAEFVYDNNDLVVNRTRFASVGNKVNNYIYDGNNNLLSVDANGQVTSMTYNNRDLMDSMTFGDDAKVYEYRDDDLLENFTRPDGTVLNHQYDIDGRVLYDGYAHYTYDSLSNLTTIARADTTFFNYDGINRLQSYTDIYDQTVSYTYDLNGNVTEILYPDGYLVEYSYDDNNRLVETAFNSGALSIDYEYLDDGRLSAIDLPNGVTTHYGYDDAGRLASMLTTRSSGDTICSYVYTLDALGNHINVQSYEPYNMPPPLTSLLYDGTYNNENEVQSYGGSEFMHNPNGEQEMKNGRMMNFDVAGMITSNGNRHYQYDALKLLREADRAGEVKRYAWDIRGMGNIIKEYDSSGSALYYYIHGVGLNARVNANDTQQVHYCHSDYRGSVVAMTNATDSITHKYQYLPYGMITQQEEEDANPFKYVGQWGVMHEGGHHYYMRARQYDAEAGRFLSEDPVWNANLYQYAGNNPISFIDPTGEVFMGNNAYTDQGDHKFSPKVDPLVRGSYTYENGPVGQFISLFYNTTSNNTSNTQYGNNQVISQESSYQEDQSFRHNEEPEWVKILRERNLYIKNLQSSLKELEEKEIGIIFLVRESKKNNEPEELKRWLKRLRITRTKITHLKQALNKT